MTSAAAKSPPASLGAALVAHMPGCVWLLDPGLGFAAVYGDAATVFGRPAGNMEALNFAGLFAPEARAAWVERVARALAGETTSAAARFAPAGPAYVITTFPVELPEGRAVGGTARELGDRDLVLRGLEALDEDRRRLGRFLHDQVGQPLSAAGLQLDLLRLDLGATAFPIRERTAEIQATLEGVMTSVRDLHAELNPAIAERVGLRAALDGLAGRLRARFGGTIRVFADATAQPPPEAAGALYRIAQEAAANAVRHAGCSTLEILLKSLRSGPAIEIRDDGRGFDTSEGAIQPRGMGILVMQHYADRAGFELRISSRPGQGTLVRAASRQPD